MALGRGFHSLRPVLGPIRHGRTGGHRCIFLHSAVTRPRPREHSPQSPMETSAQLTAPMRTPDAHAPASDEGAHENRFREVLAAYGPALRRLVGVYERDAGQREDLLQEILLSLWRALPGFRAESSLRTWVYRVAHNTGLKHQRRLGRARRKHEEHALSTAKAEASLADDPATTSEQREDTRRLQRIVAELPPLDRQLVVLHLEGLSGAEIAEVSGFTPTNVSTRLHRLREQLMRRLERETGGDPS